MWGELNPTCFIFLGKHVCDVHLLFLFLTETSNSSSVTCNDEGDSVVIVDVTEIADDNDDDGKRCAAAIVFVVAGDVTVIAFDENNVVKFFAVVIGFTE